MPTSSDSDVRRYRRRILSIGAVVGVAGFVVGAPIVNNRIEDDLERRVPEALDAAGFDGIAAAFSGQTGTLSCLTPLEDPIAAEAVAYGVRGVRAIEPLDRSCRVLSASSDGVDQTATTSPAETSAASTSGRSLGGDSTGLAAATTSTTIDTGAQDVATISGIIAASPDLSLLSVMVDATGFSSVLDGDGPVTIFAPSNAAFEALSADAIAALNGDPDLLTQVLTHHTVDGRLMLRNLTSGPLTMRDGSTVAVEVSQDSVTVDGARIVGPDTVTDRGVVHMVDRILLPGGVELSVPDTQASTNVTFDGSALTLSGVVASEAVRAQLLQAAASPDGLRSVVDEMTVDPDTGLDAATATDLAQLIAVLPVRLVSGAATFDGNLLSISGVYLSEADRDVVVVAAAAVGATSELTAPPEATVADAGELEAQLNAFVAANPILFEPSSAVLTDSAESVLDEVARLARQFDGISITIEGHTDSDGSASDNQRLSQLRALAVHNELVERGLADQSVDFEGFGSSQPVLVGGVEDKVASRRVEFKVETA